MKKCMIYVLLSLIGVPTIQAQLLTYEEMVKKITVYMPEMNIKDSVFLQEIDSKIFNSGCACLDYISNTTISFLFGMGIFLHIYMNERGKKENSLINNMSQL